MQNRPWLLHWLNKKVKNHYRGKETTGGNSDAAAE
jgi:hypothetical protein